ncbi:P-loop containing nucleoside triphosphate hydrolase protein [Colletotrichum navitas]|uniref:P-loop containing nucleoside triphosphate hydrolase protein n=1 Tax=Colletotrichum navitas TaxID=681940 RepID=A0AAD8PJJ8_9PEZI|nr:P-loop containing nucleoside triphosphate hydrolase protein [Colletotrichum navitas]KAK1565906.1 P-loop containing nucleoside triphosphate hydrolase protein [Colletotrichum navitas]
MAGIQCLNDDRIGPVAANCRGGSDLTQFFEAVVLSIVPTGMYMLAGLFWCLTQTQRSATVNGSSFKTKTTCAGTTTCSRKIAHYAEQVPAIVASAALELAAAVLTSVLVLTRRRRRSGFISLSNLMGLYLAVTVLCDIVRCRTLWLLQQSDDGRLSAAAAATFTTSLVMKVPLLLFVSRANDADLDLRHQGPGGVPRSASSSPDTTAGIFSIGFFWWIKPLIRLGYRQVLTLDDLYALSPRLALSRLADGDEDGDYDSQDDAKSSSKSTLMLLVRATGWAGLYPVLPRLVLVACTVGQASLGRMILMSVSDPKNIYGSGIDPGARSGLVAATLLVHLCIALSSACYGYLHERALTLVRGYLIRRVYQHAARLSVTSEASKSASTLVSVDVETAYNGLRHAHELWAVPVQIAVAARLAYIELGPASLVAVAVIALVCAAVAAVSPLIAGRQRAWMTALQARVAATGTMMHAIKTLRMAAFSRRVAATLQRKRTHELRLGSYFRTAMSVSASVSQVPFLVAPVLAFAVNPRQINAATAFATLGYLSLMTQPVMTAIQVVPMVLATRVCLTRIKQFLAAATHVDRRVLRPILLHAPSSADMATTQGGDGDDNENGKWDGKPDQKLAIRIANASFGWSPDARPVLRNVNVDIPMSTVTAVIGPVGCGKSTLLQAILGEIPMRENEGVDRSVAVNASRVAYCAQSPVLTDGTVRDNIVGRASASELVDEVLYKQVLEATALVDDLTRLPRGDATPLGCHGESLSGGQQQRVAIARALYHTSDLFLADNPLCSLDRATGQLVLRRVFGPDGMLRRRRVTVVMVTDPESAARVADQLLDISPTGDNVQEEGGENIMSDDHGRAAESEIFEKETAIISKETVQIMADRVDTESQRDSSNPTKCQNPRMTGTKKASETSTWLYYFSSVGLASFVLFAVWVMAFGALVTYPTIWVQSWTSDMARSSPPGPRRSSGYYIGVYGALAVSCLVANLIMGLIVLVVFVRNAGRSLHEGALQAVMMAPTYFLAAADVGAVVTYFSQDLAILDGQLAGALVNLAATAAVIAGQGVLLAISSPWLAITFPFLLAVVYLIARVYVPAAARLRVLDLEAKGPLVAHVLASASSLSTHRAFGHVSREIRHAHALLAISQKPSYFLGMAQQWMILVNNLIVTALATGLTALAVSLRLGAGSVGVGLVTLISLSRNLSDALRAYTMVEIALGAVARLMAFAQETPREKTGKVAASAEAWPAAGLISIDGVSAGYGDLDDPDYSTVLHNITLVVTPGEKVAIYGRTGSGKSSLILMVLGMLEPLRSCTRSVRIDQVVTADLDPALLRERIIAMPQNTVFLPDGATVRDNVNPLGCASTQDCRHALDAVGLLPKLSNLDAVLDPRTFSEGQRQLFGLARCVARRRARLRQGAEGGLLLLDEVTAHVDCETSAMMNEIVAREFAKYTVLAVTHQLLDATLFPRAVVMDAGRVVEDGRTRELLLDETSHLSTLHRQLDI